MFNGMEKEKAFGDTLEAGGQCMDPVAPLVCVCVCVEKLRGNV